MNTTTNIKRSKINKSLKILYLLKKRLSGKQLSKIPYLKSSYNILYDILKPKELREITINGYNMYINGNDIGLAPQLLIENKYEEEQTQLFKELLSPGMTIIDIGANIGYYTLLSASLIGKEGQIFAFEPTPINYDLLEKNVKLNNYTNIVTVKKAVSNISNQKIKLYIDNINFGGASLSKDNVTKNTDDYITTDTISIDDYFKNKKIDLVKIDVQGAESLVIDGMINIINNNSAIKIIMEFGPYGLKVVGSDPKELLIKLKKLGFHMQLVGNKKYVSIKQVIELCNKNGEKSSVNLLLSKEKLNSLN